MTNTQGQPCSSLLFLELDPAVCSIFISVAERQSADKKHLGGESLSLARGARSQSFTAGKSRGRSYGEPVMGRHIKSRDRVCVCLLACARLHFSTLP